jgi:hypothetical protein
MRFRTNHNSNYQEDIKMTLLRAGKYECAADLNCEVAVFLLHSKRRGYVIQFEHDNPNTFELSEAYDSFDEALERFEELIEEELSQEEFEEIEEELEAEDDYII